MIRSASEMKMKIEIEMKMDVNEPEFLYKYDDRLVRFAGECAFFFRSMTKDEVGVYYGKQLIRSSGSACLNFGEAQGTITIKDFVNKASIVSKELQESRNNLKILIYIHEGDDEKRTWLRQEAEELIAIA